MKNVLALFAILFSSALFAQTSIANKKWSLTHYEVNSTKAEMKADDKNIVLYLKTDNTYEYYAKGEVKHGIYHYDAKTNALLMRSKENKKEIVEFKVIKATDSDLVIESKGDPKKVITAYLRS